MKRKASFLTFIVVLLVVLLLVAPAPPSLKAMDEAPKVQWEKKYGEPIAGSLAMAQTADGGYVIAGYNSTGYDTPIHGYRQKPVLIKTDSSGNVQWEKTYDESLRFYVIVQTNDLGYALFGYGKIIKIDAEGNLQWNKTYTPLPGGIINSQGIQTSDGGYLLVGSTTNSSYPQNTVAWILKTDGNGNELWKKTFGDLFSSSPFVATSAYSAIEMHDGGCVVAGSWEGSCWLLKIDSQGDAQWNKTHDFRYNGTFGEYKYTSIGKTSDGGLILTGFASPIPFLVKVDSQGNMQWNRPYTEGGGFNSIVQSDDGGYYAVGSLNSNAWMIKTGSSGALLWGATYGDYTRSHNQVFFNSVVGASDGGYAVAGTLNDTIWLFKFAPEPDALPEYTSPPPGHVSPQFPTTWIVIGVIIVTAFGIGLLVYFKKRKH
jgi:hypothetical protein